MTRCKTVNNLVRKYASKYGADQNSKVEEHIFRVSSRPKPEQYLNLPNCHNLLYCSNILIDAITNVKVPIAKMKKRRGVFNLMRTGNLLPTLTTHDRNLKHIHLSGIDSLSVPVLGYAAPQTKVEYAVSGARSFPQVI